MNKRQMEQQLFEESGQNLTVGDIGACPVSPEELAAISDSSPYVMETFDTGLTAEVYHLCIGGKHYTLKKKRADAKVLNPDGKYSFLNEVQRRHDLQKLKNDPVTSAEFRHIVPTVYADYRLGIILSPWLEGDLIQSPGEEQVSQLFSTLLACEKAGLFEWDLCGGNMIVDEHGHLWLFDFGYMYRFEPLTELNSNGMSDPLFCFSERFETRFLSGWFIAHNLEKEESLQVFEMVKRASLRTLQSKLDWLSTSNAEEGVINHTQTLIEEHQLALSSDDELETRFLLDMFRSHVLDIEDDLHGKSCTPVTLKRIDTVLKMVEKYYSCLSRGGALFYHNEGKSESGLAELYKEKRELARQYQV